MSRLSSPATLYDLHLSLVEGAQTERRLPAAIPRRSVTFWVETATDWLAYADPSPRQRLEPATAAEITKYDALLDAIVQLPDERERRILWLTAHMAAFRTRVPWLKIGKRLGCDRRTAKRHYESALLSLFLTIGVDK
jgi:hypothetical protein